jgi:hypothetical protein
MTKHTVTRIFVGSVLAIAGGQGDLKLDPGSYSSAPWAGGPYPSLGAVIVSLGMR